MLRDDVVRFEVGGERDSLLITGAESDDVSAIVMPLVASAAA